MEMRDKDSCDNRRGDICKDKLALSSLSRIEKKALIVPTKEVSTMVAFSSGLLTRCSKYCEIFDAQDGSPLKFLKLEELIVYHKICLFVVSSGIFGQKQPKLLH